MPCFYLTPEQDDFNQELQVCLAEALYDIESILADPRVFPGASEQIVSNVERAWEITGRSDELTSDDILPLSVCWPRLSRLFLNNTK